VTRMHAHRGPYLPPESRSNRRDRLLAALILAVFVAVFVAPVVLGWKP